MSKDIIKNELIDLDKETISLLIRYYSEGEFSEFVLDEQKIIEINARLNKLYSTPLARLRFLEKIADIVEEDKLQSIFSNKY